MFRPTAKVERAMQRQKNLARAEARRQLETRVARKEEYDLEQEEQNVLSTAQLVTQHDIAAIIELLQKCARTIEIQQARQSAARRARPIIDGAPRPLDRRLVAAVEGCWPLWSCNPTWRRRRGRRGRCCRS